MSTLQFGTRLAPRSCAGTHSNHVSVACGCTDLYMALTGPLSGALRESCSHARIAARSRSIVMWAASLSLAAACGAGQKTACDGLVYKKVGLTRAEYLPCAGEMMGTLDRLSPQIEGMLSGDEHARAEARDSVRELRNLLKKAGWRDLLERWEDRALTSLNVDIWNAFNHHEACMMVAGQLFGRPPLGDEKMREPARSECRAYRQSYRDARSEYHRLR